MLVSSNASACAGGGGGSADGGVAISAGAQSASTGTVVFSNSNGVTFGMNASTITASISGDGGIMLAAGSQTATGNTVVFSNSNNITFGMSGSTRVTASFSTQPETPFGVSAGSQSVSTGTLVFSNSNNVSFGMSGSSRITASASETPFGLSAGSQSVSTGTVSFANSNGVTFGMSNSNQVTASVAQYISQFHNNSQSQSFGIVNGFEYVVPVQCPFYVSATALAMMFSASVNTSNAGTFSMSFGIYTMSQSTASLASSVQRAITWSAGNTSATDDAAAMSGLRYRTIGGNFNLTPGLYLFAFWFRTSSDGSWSVVGNGGNQSVAGFEFNGGESNLWLPGSLNGGASFVTAMAASFQMGDTAYVRTGRQTTPAATLFGTF